MFLPLDNVMNLWLTAVPIYEWVTEPPATEQEGCDTAPPAAGGNDASGAAPDNASDPATGLLTATLPPMRLVFKGYSWVAAPVWTPRENAAWEQVAQDKRDEDQQRATPNRPRPTGIETVAGSPPALRQAE